MLVLLPTLVPAETTLLAALAPAKRLMVLFHWLDSLLVRKKNSSLYLQFSRILVLQVTTHVEGSLGIHLANSILTFLSLACIVLFPFCKYGEVVWARPGYSLEIANVLRWMHVT